MELEQSVCVDNAIKETSYSQVLQGALEEEGDNVQTDQFDVQMQRDARSNAPVPDEGSPLKAVDLIAVGQSLTEIDLKSSRSRSSSSVKSSSGLPELEAASTDDVTTSKNLQGESQVDLLDLVVGSPSQVQGQFVRVWDKIGSPNCSAEAEKPELASRVVIQSSQIKSMSVVSRGDSVEEEEEEVTGDKTGFTLEAISQIPDEKTGFSIEVISQNSASSSKRNSTILHETKSESITSSTVTAAVIRKSSSPPMGGTSWGGPASGFQWNQIVTSSAENSREPSAEPELPQQSA